MDRPDTKLSPLASGNVALPLLGIVGMALVGVWSNLCGYSPALVPMDSASGGPLASGAFAAGRLFAAVLLCLFACPLERRLSSAGVVAGAVAMPVALIMVLAAGQSTVDPTAVLAGSVFLGSACSLFLSTALFVRVCQTSGVTAATAVAVLGVLAECVASIALDTQTGLDAQLLVCTLAPVLAAACLCVMGALAGRRPVPSSHIAVEQVRCDSRLNEGPALRLLGTPGTDRLSAAIVMTQLVLAMTVSSSLRSLSAMGPWGFARNGFWGMSGMDAGQLALICGAILTVSLVVFGLLARFSAQLRCGVALVFLAVGLWAASRGAGDGAASVAVPVALACQTYSRILVWVSLMMCMRQLDVPALRVNGAGTLFNVLGSWIVALFGTSDRAVTVLLCLLAAVTVAAIALPLLAHPAGGAGTEGAGLASPSGEQTEAPSCDPAKLRMFAQAHGLSGREEQVLGLLAQGLKRGEIERLLGLSEGTVRTHINNTYRKLGVHSKTEATETLLGWEGEE